MNRTTVLRIAFTAIAAPALVVGLPAMAMADSFYEKEWDAAGPHGAVSHHVVAFAGDGDNGDYDGVFYHKSMDAAGPHGAVHGSVTSAAD